LLDSGFRVLNLSTARLRPVADSLTEHRMASLRIRMQRLQAIDFEEWQKINDKRSRSARSARRARWSLIQPPSFQLKGGGWYGDLYASKRPANAGNAKSNAGADGKAAGSTSSSSEGGAASKETASPTSGAEPRPRVATSRRLRRPSATHVRHFNSASSTRIVERQRVVFRNKEETMKVRPLYDRF